MGDTGRRVTRRGAAKDNPLPPPAPGPTAVLDGGADEDSNAGSGDGEATTETLISFLSQYQDLIASTADILKDEIRVIKERRIDKNKAILEKEKGPEAVRLGKSIVVGYQDSIAKAVKDFQCLGNAMGEDLQRRFNLPPDWYQSTSIFGSITGSEIMGPTSMVRNREMQNRISSFINDSVAANAEAIKDGEAKGNAGNFEMPLVPDVVGGENGVDGDDDLEDLLGGGDLGAPIADEVEEAEDDDTNVVPESDEEADPVPPEEFDQAPSPTTPETAVTPSKSGSSKAQIKVKREQHEKSSEFQTPKKKDSPGSSSSSAKKTPKSSVKKETPVQQPAEPMETSDADADSDASDKTCVLPSKNKSLKSKDVIKIKKELMKTPTPVKSASEAVEENQEEPQPAASTPKKTPVNVKKEMDSRTSRRKTANARNESDDGSSNEEETFKTPPEGDNVSNGATDPHDSFMEFLAPPSPSSPASPMETGGLLDDDVRTVVLPGSAKKSLFPGAEHRSEESKKNTIAEKPSSSKGVSIPNPVAKTPEDVEKSISEDKSEDKPEKEKKELRDKENEDRKNKLQQNKEDRALIRDVLGSSSDSDSTPSKKPPRSLSRRRKNSVEEEDKKSDDKVGQATCNPKDDPKLKEIVRVDITRFDSAIEKSLNENGFIRLKDFSSFKKMSYRDLESKNDSSDSDSSIRSDDSAAALKKLVKDLTRKSVLETKKYNKKRGPTAQPSKAKKKSSRNCKSGELDSSSDSDDTDDNVKKLKSNRPKFNDDTIRSDSGSEDLNSASDTSMKGKKQSKSTSQSKDSKGKKPKNYKTVTLSSDDDGSGNEAMRLVLGSDSDTDNNGRRKRTLRPKREKNSDSETNSDFAPSKRPLRGRDKKKVKSDSDVSLLTISSGSDSDSDFKTSQKKKRRRDRDSSPEQSKKNKKKRRRIITKSSSSGSDSDDIQEIPQEKPEGEGEGDEPSSRKNIRKIMKSKHLAKTTKEAERDEEERRKRLSERQNQFNGVHKAPESDKIERLVLDVDPDTKEVLVEVDKSIVRHLKPHQADGIKFMYNACYESVEMVKEDKAPGGCILAHCMGLGKTLQSVAFMHTMLTNQLCGTKTVLVICPLSTVTNWFNETRNWTEEADQQLKIHKLYDMKNTVASRVDYLKVWQRRGGVGILHYDMFRRLADPKGKGKQKESFRKAVKEALLDPGPDMVICDEGHLLKNCKSILSLAVNNIRTHRRVVLTGTPLQNNLVEYHTMMSFVKPNLLGSLHEFTNRFVNPIKNGQHADSTDYDVKTMKRRAHVLHRKLEGCVQRCDYSILSPYLPPKYEYIINIKLSEKQEKLYKHYLGSVVDQDPDARRKRLLKYYAELVKVWSHPIALTMRKMTTDEEEEESSDNSLRDFICDDETEEESKSDEGSDGGPSKKSKRKTRAQAAADPDPVDAAAASLDDCMFGGKWWNAVFKSKSEMQDIELSGKLVILQEILRTCEAIGDRVLVFSQFLTSLNIIEEFLADWDDEVKKEENGTDKILSFPEILKPDSSRGRWRRNVEYFRIDGQTKVADRHRDCEKFNRKSALSRAKLFLISTRAGGLGINLYGANRVVIFDASWNPSQDMQSIFRVYRFGQEKPCYIYRLIARGTMEEKILRRQITKLSLSSRVVDEHQIQRHFKFDDVNEMYLYDEEDPSASDAVLAVPKDRLLADLLMSHRTWIRSYEEFDSLLENKPDEGLSNEEKELAWAEYRIESDRVKHSQPLTSNSAMQAETYVKVKPKLHEKYPTANEEQLEQATQISLRVISKIREGMLVINQPGFPPDHPSKAVINAYIEPLKYWLAQSIQVQPGETCDIQTDLLDKQLPVQFYQPMPRMAPVPPINYAANYGSYQPYQQQQNFRPPIIRRPPQQRMYQPNNYQNQMPVHNIQTNFQNIAANTMQNVRPNMLNHLLRNQNNLMNGHQQQGQP